MDVAKICSQTLTKCTLHLVCMQQRCNNYSRANHFVWAFVYTCIDAVHSLE